MTDHEWESKQNKKIERLVHTANFKQSTSLADIDYSQNRNLDKNMFQRLGTLIFVTQKQNVILTGASGVGKSYLAQALGNQACMMGYKVYYATTSRLLNKLKLAKVDGAYLKELKKLAKVNLLILDDFGLQAFDNHSREVLMDIIDDRFNQMSSIVSS